MLVRRSKWFMSGDQNAGRSYSIKNDNRFFERVEVFTSKFYSGRN